jgi:HD-GYP domain-containing protein (c-di-GMP phosphodiesterase class II)
MWRPNLRARYIVLIVTVHTLCAGAALWICYQMVASAITKNAPPDLAAKLSSSLLVGIGCAMLWLIVLMTVIIYLFVTQIFDRFTRVQRMAEAEAFQQMQSLSRAHDAIIVGLAKLSESRDDETGRHLERISAYACRLATAASCHPKFRNQISGEFVELLRISAPMHDIGKVGIPDNVLLKPGPLTTAERSEIQKHPTIGGRCLLEIEQRLESSSFLQMSREIVLAHHERWDGAGYPAGLTGEAIPLAARITSIADVYDALSSDRVYRKGYPHEQCVAMIEREAGKQFDPDLVEVFVTIQQSFRDIAQMYGSDNEGHKEHEQTAKPSCLPLDVSGAPLAGASPVPTVTM